jgi:hypothetical protein
MKFGTTPTVRILFGIVTKWGLTIRWIVHYSLSLWTYRSSP